MQCPVDGTTLVMADRSGVEIDYCPTCRGVWLDRGELDKIIERSAAMAPPPPPPPQTREQLQPRAQPTQAYRDDDYRYERKRKKKSGVADLLGDIFDF